MEAKAILKHVRITPRKVRLVVDLIRGKKVEEAYTILRFVPKRAAKILDKVLKSAVANAQDRKIGDPDDLRITEAYVDGGPSYKRFFARAMGRSNIVKKRTSHITLVVAPKENK